MANKIEYNLVKTASELASVHCAGQNFFNPRVEINPINGRDEVHFALRRGSEYFGEGFFSAHHIVRVSLMVEDMTQLELEQSVINSRESCVAFLDRNYPGWREVAI